MSLPQIVELEFEASEILEQTQVTHKEFAFDFDKGEFTLKDGNLVLVDGIEYLKTWIQHILRSKRGTLLYKESNYGSEYEYLIGQRLPTSMFMSELERMIRETLLQNDKIQDIENFNIERVKSRLIVSFDVSSDYGILNESVVI